MVILQFSNEVHERSILYLRVKMHQNCSKRLLTLSQEQYIKRVLKHFHMENCNLIDTPMTKSEKLRNKLCLDTPKQKEQVEKVHYANAVESLM